MPKLKRDVVKYVRDKAKSKICKGLPSLRDLWGRH